MKRRMIAAVPAVSLVAVACGFAIAQKTEATEFARYEAMMNRSPFGIRTVASSEPATAEFAKDLYIGNAARAPEGALVTLMSGTDKLLKKYLTSWERVDGFLLVDIEWSDKPGATTATIEKDGQFATLTLNPPPRPASPSGPVPRRIIPILHE